MVLVHDTKAFIFSSRGSDEVQPLNDIGSSFRVTRRDPIKIEEDCEKITLEVNMASIWNSSPNISDVNGNNHFVIEYNGEKQDIVIVNGLYGVSELNGYLQQKIKELGFPEDLLILTGDSSTQKTIISFKYDNTIIYWDANSCWEIIGFEQGTTTTADADNSVYGDLVAEFNRISSYYITSNLVTDGIPVNNLNPGIIATIPITEKPGSLMTFEPINPVSCSATKLKQGMQTIEFTLYDQLLRPVIMPEIWLFSVVIKYSYFKRDKTLS